MSVFRKLLPLWTAKLHTHIFSTVVSERLADVGELPPQLSAIPGASAFDLFYSRVIAGAASRQPRQMAPHEALATSCSLPFVEPLQLHGVTFVDGGIYSNLPIDVLKYGGVPSDWGFGIAILCNAVTALNPAGSLVDWRSAKLLDTVLAMQRRRGLPTFVLSPTEPLPEEDLVRGLLSEARVQELYADGFRCGAAFNRSLERFLLDPVAGEDGIAKFDIRDVWHCSVPVHPPDNCWISWVDRRWRKINRS
jgi:hypothetical protein